MTHESEWSPGDIRYRVKLKAHKSGGKMRGYYVYIPRDTLQEALGTDPPETIYAARLVLQKGQRQILIRLYREKE